VALEVEGSRPSARLPVSRFVTLVSTNNSTSVLRTGILYWYGFAGKNLSCREPRLCTIMRARIGQSAYPWGEPSCESGQNGYVRGSRAFPESLGRKANACSWVMCQKLKCSAFIVSWSRQLHPG
jgi:hypothetical protein